MKTKRRWLNSVLNEAAKSNTKMPWFRGQRRAEMTARRNAGQTPKTVASA